MLAEHSSGFSQKPQLHSSTVASTKNLRMDPGSTRAGERTRLDVAMLGPGT